MSIATFKAQRRKYRDELARHEAELLARLKKLDDILWDRPFNEDEKKTRSALVDELSFVRNEQFFLAELDVREFDKQRRIKELIKRFQALQKDATKRREKLEDLVGNIKTATKVIQATEKLTEQLIKLLA